MPSGYEAKFVKSREAKSRPEKGTTKPKTAQLKAEEITAPEGEMDAEAPSTSTVSTSKYNKSLTSKDWMEIRARGMGQWAGRASEGEGRMQGHVRGKEKTLGLAFQKNMSALGGNKLSLVDQGITRITALRADLLPQVKVLYLSNNNIGSLKGLELYRHVEVLSITNNVIRYTDQLLPLGQLTQLTRLSITGNSVEEMPYFRDKLLALCPRLESLDGIKITAQEREAAKVTSGMAAVVCEQLQQNELRNLILRHLSVQTRVQVLLLRQVVGHFSGLHGGDLPTADDGTDACMDRTGTMLRRLLRGGTFYWLQIGCREHFDVLMEELAHAAHSTVLSRLDAAGRSALLRSPRALTKHWDKVNAQIAAAQQDHWIDLIRVCEAHRDDTAAFYSKRRGGVDVDARRRPDEDRAYRDAAGADARQSLESIAFLPPGDLGRDADRRRLYCGAGPYAFASRENPIRSRQATLPPTNADINSYSNANEEKEGKKKSGSPKRNTALLRAKTAKRADARAQAAAARVTYKAMGGEGFGLTDVVAGETSYGAGVSMMSSTDLSSDDLSASSILLGAGQAASDMISTSSERYRLLLSKELGGSSKAAGAAGAADGWGDDLDVSLPRPSPPLPTPPRRVPRGTNFPHGSPHTHARRHGREGLRQSYPTGDRYGAHHHQQQLHQHPLRSSTSDISSSRSSSALGAGLDKGQGHGQTHARHMAGVPGPRTRAGALAGVGPSLDLKAVQQFITRVIQETAGSCSASSSSSASEGEGQTRRPFTEGDDFPTESPLPLPNWVQGAFDLDAVGPPIAIPKRLAARTIALGATGGEEPSVTADELKALADIGGLGVRQLQTRVEDISLGLGTFRAQWLTASTYHLKLRKRAEGLRERMRKCAAAAVDRLKGIQEQVARAQDDVDVGGAWVGRTGAVLRQLDVERDKVAAAKELLARTLAEKEEIEEATLVEKGRKETLLASATDLATAMLDVGTEIDNSPGLKLALAGEKLRARASLLAKYLLAIKRHVFRTLRSRVHRQMAIKRFVENRSMSYRVRVLSICYVEWMAFIVRNRRRDIAARWVRRARAGRHLAAWEQVFRLSRRVKAHLRSRLHVRAGRLLRYWRAVTAEALVLEASGEAATALSFRARDVANRRRITAFYRVRCFRAWRRYADSCLLPPPMSDRLEGRATRHHKRRILLAWRGVTLGLAACLRRASALLDRRLQRRLTAVVFRVWSSTQRATNHEHAYALRTSLMRLQTHAVVCGRQRQFISRGTNWHVRQGARMAVTWLHTNVLWRHKARQAERSMRLRREHRVQRWAWRGWLLCVSESRRVALAETRALSFFMRRLAGHTFNHWAMRVSRSRALRQRYLQPSGDFDSGAEIGPAVSWLDDDHVEPKQPLQYEGEQWVLASEAGHPSHSHSNSRRPPLPTTGHLRVPSTAHSYPPNRLIASLEHLGVELYRGKYQAVHPLCGEEWLSDEEDDLEVLAWRGTSAITARIRAKAALVRWRRVGRRRHRLKISAAHVRERARVGILRRIYGAVLDTFTRALRRHLNRDESKLSPDSAPEGAGALSADALRRVDAQNNALRGRIEERKAEIATLTQDVELKDRDLRDGEDSFQTRRLAMETQRAREEELLRRLSEGQEELSRLQEGVARSRALLGEDGRMGMEAVREEVEVEEARLGAIAQELTSSEENKMALLGDVEAAYQIAVTRQAEAQTRLRRIRARKAEAVKKTKRAQSQLKYVDKQLQESRERQAALESVLAQCTNALKVASARVAADSARHDDEIASLRSQEEELRTRGDRARRRTDKLIGELNQIRTEVEARRRALRDVQDEVLHSPALTEMAAVALVEAGQAAAMASSQHLGELSDQNNRRVQALATAAAHSHTLSGGSGSRGSSGGLRVIGSAGVSMDLGADIENESRQLRSQRVRDAARSSSPSPARSGSENESIRTRMAKPDQPALRMRQGKGARGARPGGIRNTGIIGKDAGTGTTRTSPSSSPSTTGVRAPEQRSARLSKGGYVLNKKKTTSNGTTSSSGSSSSPSETSSPSRAGMVKGSALDCTFDTVSSALELSRDHSSYGHEQVESEITALSNRIRSRLENTLDI